MIKKTTNYEQFKTLERNRVISKHHLKDLKASISADDRLQYNPIIVNDNMEVLDGQHRLRVAEELGIPIYYVISPDAGMETVARLQTQKKWTMSDWVASYAKGGNQDYMLLKDYAIYYGLPISMSANLLSGLKNLKGGGGSTSERIRNGAFKARNVSKAREFGDRYKETHDLIKKRFTSTRQFILAISKLLESDSYDHTRMLRKLKHYAKKLTYRENYNDYLRDLEAIYNLKEQTKQRLF